MGWLAEDLIGASLIVERLWVHRWVRWVIPAQRFSMNPHKPISTTVLHHQDFLQ